jgi:uncharacterized protein
LGVGGFSASAQSFDCKKAATPFEKFICADRDLAAADSKLAAAYQAALAQLSEEGKRRLVESQRSWIKYDRNTTKLDVGYWKATYAARTKQLESSLQTFGPYRIQSVTIYKAEIKGQGSAHSATPPADATENENTSSDESDTAGNVAYTFPRIESPSTAETARWNRLAEEHIRSFAGEPESATSLDVGYGITYAAPDVISLDLGAMSFVQGTAHPNFSGAGYIVLLRSGIELKASDLFAPSKPWKTFLKDIVFRKLKAQAAKKDWYFNTASAAELDADDIKRWTITKQGLKVSFVQYEVSDYASGPHEVVVTWAELNPYLNAALPFAAPQSKK